MAKNFSTKVLKGLENFYKSFPKKHQYFSTGTSRTDLINALAAIFFLHLKKKRHIFVALYRKFILVMIKNGYFDRFFARFSLFFIGIQIALPILEFF